MRRDEERTATVDHLPAVGLERVGGIVQLDPEQQPQEGIGRAVEKHLHIRIVNISYNVLRLPLTTVVPLGLE